jgi:uncharacterized metal-binding protein
VENLVVIDGCEIGCAKAIKKNMDIPMKSYVVLTEHGIKKNKNFNLEREDIDRVKAVIKNGAEVKSTPGGQSCCR